jgi:Zn2+/Cd2+-exporting ATPase
MGDGFSKLPYSYTLSNKANGVIRQDIWASLGVTGNALRLSRIDPE